MENNQIKREKQASSCGNIQNTSGMYWHNNWTTQNINKEQNNNQPSNNQNQNNFKTKQKINIRLVIQTHHQWLENKTEIQNNQPVTYG